MLELKVKYLTDIKPIVVEEKGDWIDLRCADTIELEARQSAIIPLGVAIELPAGYSAIIAPRSSTFKKWHILQTNSIGVIDNSYCGDNDEWCLPVYAISKTTIYKNDRICQFRIIKNEPVSIMKVDKLGNPDRNGFGSTGVN